MHTSDYASHPCQRAETVADHDRPALPWPVPPKCTLSATSSMLLWRPGVRRLDQPATSCQKLDRARCSVAWSIVTGPFVSSMEPAGEMRALYMHCRVYPDARSNVHNLFGEAHRDVPAVKCMYPVRKLESLSS